MHLVQFRLQGLGFTPSCVTLGEESSPLGALSRTGDRERIPPFDDLLTSSQGAFDRASDTCRDVRTCRLLLFAFFRWRARLRSFPHGSILSG